jgi:hypothetical protein
MKAVRWRLILLVISALTLFLSGFLLGEDGQFVPIYLIALLFALPALASGSGKVLWIAWVVILFAAAAILMDHQAGMKSAERIGKIRGRAEKAAASQN